VLVDDPPEEVAGAGAVQVLQGFRNGDLDVLRGDLVGGGRGIDGAEPLDHRITATPGEGEVVAFDGELGEQVVIHGVDNAIARQSPHGW
jgi:hypothetical protein